MSASARFAVAADCVFDGETLHRHAAVVVDGARIAQIVPRADIGVPRIALPEGAWLAPGFVDLQVNGGGDVLFNDAPTAESIATIAAAHRRFGTTGFLPTLITDRPEKTAARDRRGPGRDATRARGARSASRGTVSLARQSRRA